ncbi:CHAD domain-containing protein [uncultured Microbulbifer sp.]|uniref:CHAD domain-containing protein n=1 Tax=uncultured Microbulbifer sp. TaxID=348147 RepID=UPI002635FFB4|nr:CHAD domain-containing protein [uncultured Microbulbifer sp.]
MVYRLNSKQTLAAALAATAQAEVADAISALNTLPEHEAVHEVRKHCKKMRALLRLIRADHKALYRRENAHYRTLANQLSANRDLVSIRDAFSAIATPVDFPRTHAFITGRSGRLGDRAALGQVGELLLQGAGRIPFWPLAQLRWKHSQRGFLNTYRHACSLKTVAISRKSAETLHEYRKHTKDHWYHCRLLQERYPPLADRCTPLEALAQALGDWRDLYLLCTLLKAEEEALSGELIPLLEATSQRRTALFHQIKHLSADLFPKGKFVLFRAHT